MKPTSSSSAAFTLIEVVITVFVTTIVMIAVIDMYGGYLRTFATQQTYVDIARSAHSIVNAVDATARQATTIVSSRTFSGTLYTTSSTTVVFELPSINSSGQTISGTYDYVAIYATGTSAYYLLELGSGSVRGTPVTRLSNTLEGLTFTYNNASVAAATKIDTYATTSAVVRNQTLRSHLHQQSFLRNK